MPTKIALSADEVVSETDNCPECGSDALRYEPMIRHGGMYEVTSGLVCQACRWSKVQSERCPECGTGTLVNRDAGDQDSKVFASCGWAGSLRDVSLHGEG